MSQPTVKTVETAAAVDRVLEWASRAPSVHNTQPWTWRVHNTRIDLFADFRRQLVHTDPQRRDLLISCGAALHHLQVAAGALGWAPQVYRAPDPGDDRVVATVELTRTAPPPDGAKTLALLGRRVTDRRRLSSWPVPPERLDALAMAGSTWGAHVIPIEQERTKARLERLVRRADGLQQQSSQYRDEVDTWVTESDSQGVPAGHVPQPDTVDTSDALTRRFLRGTLEDLALDGAAPGDGMLLICTSSDDPLSRIRAGEALSAMWLQATCDNLSLVPLSQALEVAATRRILQNDVLDNLAVAQLMLRVGWPPMSRSELSPTPRRALDESRVRY